MKKVLLAGVALSAVVAVAAGSATAADLPLPVNPYVGGPAPVFSWSGCSIGAHVGWGWSRTTLSDTPGGSSSSLIDFSGFGRSASISGNGVVGGGQLGCDYQFNPWFVAGVQASFAGADINGTAGDPFAFGSAMTAKTDFLSDLSIRLGYAWNNWLFYGKGGAAWAHNHYSFTSSAAATAADAPFGAYSSSGTDVPFGALAGLGVEWAFWGNWSAFLEYDHYFFGTDTVTFNTIYPATGASIINLVNARQDIDEVKVGVNYHFNFWPQPAEYRY
jgi:outer membrane immunogenic protein